MSSYADIAAKGPKQSDAEKVPDAVPEILHEDSGVHTINSMTASKSPIPSYAEQQRAKEEAEKAQAEVEKTAKETADKTAKHASDFADKAEQDLSRLEAEGSQSAQDVGKQIRASLSKMRTQSGKQFEQTAKDVQDNLAKLSKDGSKQYQQFAESTQESLKKLKESMSTWDKDASKKVDQFSKEASKQFDGLKKDARDGGEKAKEGAQKAEAWAERNKGNPVVIGNALVIGALASILGVGANRMHKAGTLTWNVAGTWAGALALFAVGDYYVSQYFFRKYPTK